MEQSISTEQLSVRSSRSGDNKLLIVAVIIAVLLSVIAIILALVSIGKTTPIDINISNIGSSGGNGDDDKIWLFASREFGVDYWNYGYIHGETGEHRGFNVDIVNAVCEIANKNCDIVFDAQPRCWDSKAGTRAVGGEGIMAGYYDGCLGYGHTYGRNPVLRFSDPYASNPESLGFVTLAGNPRSFNWLDLTGKVIGFKDGSFADEHCVSRVERIQGSKLSSVQIQHYADTYALYEALDNGEIDAIFYTIRDVGAGYSAVSDGVTCAMAGLSVMTRKDNRLIDWWNPAFEKLKPSSQYQDICKDLTEEHGDVGGPDSASTCLKN